MHSGPRLTACPDARRERVATVHISARDWGNTGGETVPQIHTRLPVPSIGMATWLP